MRDHTAETGVTSLRDRQAAHREELARQARERELVARVEGIARQMQQRLPALKRFMDQVESLAQHTRNRLNAAFVRLETAETKIGNIQDAGQLVKTRVDDLETADDALSTRVDNLQAAGQQLSTRMDNLQSNAQTRLNNLETRVTALEAARPPA